eukprot:77587_1
MAHLLLCLSPPRILSENNNSQLRETTVMRRAGILRELQSQYIVSGQSRKVDEVLTNLGSPLDGDERAFLLKSAAFYNQTNVIRSVLAATPATGMSSSEEAWRFRALGWTPLMVALKRRNFEAAAVLLVEGEVIDVISRHDELTLPQTKTSTLLFELVDVHRKNRRRNVVKCLLLSAKMPLEMAECIAEFVPV